MNRTALTAWLLLFGVILNFDKTLMSLVVQVLQKDLGWSASDAGDLLSVIYVSFCLATVPSGWIIDRYHYRGYVRCSLAIICLGSLLFFAASQSTTLLAMPIVFLAIRFLTGLGYPGYTTGVPKIIQENYEHSVKGTVQGFVLSTFGIGAIISFTVGIHFIAQWQYLYLVLAAGFAFLWLTSAALPRAQVTTDIKAKPKIDFFAAWRDRNTLILALLMIVIDMVCMAIMNWLPTLLNQKFGLQTNDMTSVLLGYAVVLTVGVSTVAILRKKFFMGKEGIFIALCSVFSAALLFWFETSDSLIVATVTMYGANLLLTWSFGLIWVMPFDFVKPAMMASSFAVINIGSFIGGIAQGTLIGRIVDWSGSFTAAILFMAAALLIAAILPQMLRKVSESAPANNG